MKNVFSKKPPTIPGTTPESASPNETRTGDTLECQTDLFSVGVSTDCNKRYRKTMEDTFTVVKNYLDIPDCGFFGVYDGHAGPMSSKICAQELHKIIGKIILAQNEKKDKNGELLSVVECMNLGFLKMDDHLKQEGVNQSGSTAVVAIVGHVNALGQLSPPSPETSRKIFVANVGDARAVLGTPVPQPPPSASHLSDDDNASCNTVRDSVQLEGWDAYRLSYDHKASDPNEQKRVANAGGIVLNNRVNGMLAVSRSFGDLYMKDYVIGSPYTTETDLLDRNILVMASDGLWDVCGDSQTIQMAHTALNNGQTCKQVSAELLTHAIQEFSADNLTVLVAKLN